LSEESMPKWPLYASISMGLLYMIVGIVYVLSGFGAIHSLPASEDIIGSLMLFIVSAVFLTGVKPLLKGQEDGYAFTLVATAIAAILFVLQLIVVGTNALGLIIGLEDWMDWTPLNSLSPAIWLFGIILIGVALLRVTGRLGGERGVFPIGG